MSWNIEPLLTRKKKKSIAKLVNRILKKGENKSYFN